MWSLPDIKKLNEAAVQREKETSAMTTKQILEGKTCDSCGSRARYAEPYYDVFSDEVKGRVFACHKHFGDHGGYFMCDKCGRLMVENYTWENYHTILGDELMCLNCALDEQLEDESNWLTDPSQVTWDLIRGCKHLIPVGGEYWKRHLDFKGNVEFDSLTGACISGGGVDELKSLVAEVTANAGRCMLIMDAAYQFSVSIGVYVKVSN